MGFLFSAHSPESVGANLKKQGGETGIMLLNWLKLHLNREEGQGLVEYGLIIALVALVVVAALTLVGGNLTQRFNDIAGSM